MKAKNKYSATALVAAMLLAAAAGARAGSVTISVTGSAGCGAGTGCVVQVSGPGLFVDADTFDSPTEYQLDGAAGVDAYGDFGGGFVSYGPHSWSVYACGYEGICDAVDIQLTATPGQCDLTDLVCDAAVSGSFDAASPVGPSMGGAFVGTGEVGYSLSDSGMFSDGYGLTFSGTATVEPAVPEPPSAALVAVAFLMVFALLRKRAAVKDA